MIKRENWITPKLGVRIFQKGVFDLDEVYGEIRKFFEKYRYTLHEKENATKKEKKFHLVIVDFRANRKIDAYARFNIEVKIKAKVDPKKVQYKKRKLSKGSVELMIKAYFILDYKKRWTISKIGQFLNDFYNNYIIRDKIDDVYSGKLFGEFVELQNEIKDELNFCV